MGDFPSDWALVRDLEEGGQGHTFVVKAVAGDDPREYVLKRLKNPKREDYFEREVSACQMLTHPSVLKIVTHGRTPKGKPYLVTPFCSGGSLEKQQPYTDLLEGLQVFRQICDAISEAHNKNIFHLDVKPANIFLEAGVPVVGDFGICFVEDSQYVLTSEGPRGSMYYCAPELRDQQIAHGVSLATADVYSLGKVLYWLFTHEVFDGHEYDYDTDERRLSERFTSTPEFAFVDEIVEGTVQRDPIRRIQKGFSTATNLWNRVDAVIRRIQAGGRVLDLRKTMRCVFCANGSYLPYPNQLHIWPARDKRTATKPVGQHWDYGSQTFQALRTAAENFDGSVGTGQPVPLILVCQHCGNTQLFRFDLTRDALDVWKP
jgi:serine/threonine protein kinase